MENIVDEVNCWNHRTSLQSTVPYEPSTPQDQVNHVDAIDTPDAVRAVAAFGCCCYLRRRHEQVRRVVSRRRAAACSSIGKCEGGPFPRFDDEAEATAAPFAPRHCGGGGSAARQQGGTHHHAELSVSDPGREQEAASRIEAP
jgi:hypothetical protein